MENEFIPYEQALVLKELGFNEKCFGGYLKDNKELWIGYVESQGGEQFNRDYHIPTPLYQQSFRWFREKYKIIYSVGMHEFDKYCFGIQLIDCGVNDYPNIAKSMKWDINDYKSYEEAELECLKKLIEIVKNK